MNYVTISIVLVLLLVLTGCSGSMPNPVLEATPAPTELVTPDETTTASTPAAPAIFSARDLPSVPRLRALDFSPFEDALANFTPDRAMAIDAIVLDATVPQVRQAAADGKLTYEELALYFLARVKQYDDALRAYLELNPNALEEAQAADARWKEGRPLGPMDGIPVTLKDNIATAGPMHTTGGAEILQDHVADADAPLVQSLRDSGAVILGKANLSELAGAISAVPGASAVGGLTQNPHGNYSTLGSSSGSAAGTAAYETMVSVGTETSGSLIAPSSINGVVGMYPGRGVVDGTDVIPLILNNDTPGPIGRSVTDVAAMLGAIDTGDVDYLASLDAQALDGVHAGLLKSAILDHASDPFEDTADNTAVAALIENALSKAGATVTPTELTGIGLEIDGLMPAILAGGIRYDMLPGIQALGPRVTTPEELAQYNQEDPERRIPFGQDVLTRFMQIQAFADKTDFDAKTAEVKAAVIESLDAALADYDFLVTVNNYTSAMYATANYPAITVPLGLRANGTPVGATFIGKPGDEANLLAYAYAFEQANPLRVDPKMASAANSSISVVAVPTETGFNFVSPLVRWLYLTASGLTTILLPSIDASILTGN
jgi:amidase